MTTLPATESTLLGSTSTPISRIGIGGCPLGGYGWGEADDDAARSAVRAALDAGINFFDTADCYGLGHSETLLSEALGADRHRVVIATKFGVRTEKNRGTWYDASPSYLRLALEQSLRRLRLDCIPLYYIHWPDPLTPMESTLEELHRCREEGKVGAIGLSNFAPTQLCRARNLMPIAAAQTERSLIHRESSQPLVDCLTDTDTSIISWGSLAQGILTGKFSQSTRFAPDDRRSRYPAFQGYAWLHNLQVAEVVKQVAGELGKTPAQVAIRWLLDAAGVDVVLTGVKTPQQVTDNLGALGWKLGDEHLHALDAGSDRSLPHRNAG